MVQPQRQWLLGEAQIYVVPPPNIDSIWSLLMYLHITIKLLPDNFMKF